MGCFLPTLTPINVIATHSSHFPGSVSPPNLSGSLILIILIILILGLLLEDLLRGLKLLGLLLKDLLRDLKLLGLLLE
jgi:hypothetical protein